MFQKQIVGNMLIGKRYYIIKFDWEITSEVLYLKYVKRFPYTVSLVNACLTDNKWSTTKTLEKRSHKSSFFKGQRVSQLLTGK